MLGLIVKKDTVEYNLDRTTFITRTDHFNVHRQNRICAFHPVVSMDHCSIDSELHAHSVYRMPFLMIVICMGN